ncbi:high affinity immunoglobulin epsilon receptor subunit beta-like isoform X2 [Zalophus californianus]|uniref:high affinity immunoglobulin epsilon receptor subunit beta-like isoform X2 n=1 Tax=Zalophus californianus TaxID=9704 RepID=UPI000F7FDD61|nr:high affinity immunoglobulin epsilon receptor subunit beta-like isoform X2 [Zalophus californianus]
MNKTLNSDRMPADIPPNQNQSTPLGKIETSSTLKHLLDKLQKFLKGNLEALGFIISGILTVASAKKQTTSLLKGNLGANILSTLVSIIGICILSYNLTKNGCYDCKKETFCLDIKLIANGLVIVLILLTCLQILISLPLSMLNYDVDDKNIHWISLLFCWKTPSEGLYQDLFPQTSIYQELERKKETPSRYPTDTSKQIGGCTSVF